MNFLKIFRELRDKNPKVLKKLEPVEVDFTTCFNLNIDSNLIERFNAEVQVRFI